MEVTKTERTRGPLTRAILKTRGLLTRAVLTGLVTLSAACGDSSPGGGTGPGRLESDRTSIDFGTVGFGQRVTIPIRLTNPGAEPVSICLPGIKKVDCSSATALEDSADSFDWPQPDMTWSLGANESTTFSVSFVPMVEGPVTGRLAIGSSGTTDPITINLAGVGGLPTLRLSSQSLDFGDVNVGQRKERMLSISNETVPRADLPIRFKVSPTGLFGVKTSDGVELGGATPFVVAPSQTAEVVVWFKPTQETSSSVSGTLELSPCTIGCVSQVSLSGKGVRPVATLSPPTTVDFGTHVAGVVVERTLTVSNTGSGPLTIQGVDIDVAGSGEFFAEGNDFPMTVNPGGSAEIRLQHLGATPGADQAKLTLVSDAVEAPFVTLIGSSTGPEIAADPPAFDFGMVNPAAGSSSTKTLNIRNLGTDPLMLSRIAIEGDGFSIVGEPSLDPVPPNGGARTVSIRFAPSSVGQKTGRLIVESNDFDEATTVVPLVGIGGVPGGCSLGAAPFDANFGVVPPGQVRELPIVVRNVGGAVCSLGAMQVSSTGSAFQLTSNAGARTVESGAMTVASVTYAPETAGAHTGQLEVFDTQGQAMLTVPLGGSSEKVALRVVPSPLDLGVAAPNCYAPSAFVRLHNDSGTSLALRGIAFDPSTSDEFVVTGIRPVSIGPGNYSDVEIRYRPREAGRDYGVLYVDFACVDSGCVTKRVAVPVMGEGVDGLGPVVDTFDQAVSLRSDILFVVQLTNTTTTERKELAADFGDFLTKLDAIKTNYRIAAVSMNPEETGLFLRDPDRDIAVLTSATPDPTTVFRYNIGADEKPQGYNFPPGDGLVNGLNAAVWALTEPRTSGTNRGFLRQDAMLSMIFLSDGEGSFGDVSAAANFLSGYKDLRGRMTRINAIVCTASSGGPLCQTSFGYGEYAPTFMALTDLTGGYAASIAASYSASLQELAEFSAGRSRRFPLRGNPTPGSISVQVDGVTVTSPSWTYVTEDRSILFRASSVPRLGSRIQVSYGLACIGS